MVETEEIFNNPPIQSAPYRISRVELGRVGALQYIRSFWWILISVPISGILILLFMTDSLSHLMGIMFLLWPLTIPGRVIAVTWRKARKLTESTTAEFKSDGLYLMPNDGIGTRVPWDWMRKVWQFGDIYVIEGRILQFIPVRKSAFDLQHQIEIEELLIRQGKTKHRTNL